MRVARTLAVVIALLAAPAISHADSGPPILVETTADDGWSPSFGSFAARFDRPLDAASTAEIVDATGAQLPGTATVDGPVITYEWSTTAWRPFTITFDALSATDPGGGSTEVVRTFDIDGSHPYTPDITSHDPPVCIGTDICHIGPVAWIPGEPIEGTAADRDPKGWFEPSGIRAAELWVYGPGNNGKPHLRLRSLLPCEGGCNLTAAFSIGIEALPPGLYGIRAVVFDRAGNRSTPSDPIEVLKPY